MKTFISFVFFLFCAASVACAAENFTRETVNFDRDWRFARYGLQADGTRKEEPATISAADFDDTVWRKLDVPHDWGIEGPFRADLSGDTAKLPWQGIGWYRKHFSLPASDAGKRVFVDFDGAMAYAKVFCNGHYVGAWPYGYSSFRMDLTPFLKLGQENVLAVRLDTEKWSSRWYPGAGIYRHVRLVKTNPVHVGQWGTFVTTPEVTDVKATVKIAVSVDNQGVTAAKAVVRTEIFELNADDTPGAKVAASDQSNLELAPNSSATANQQAAVANPKRWDLATPNRYLARTEVKVNGKEVDFYDTRFGIRTLKFTAREGFLLNGKRVEIHGTCNHGDLGALGVAVNTRGLQRQIEILKSMGCNSLRTSHNPPAPEQLDLADKMGMLVWDEAFDCWSVGKHPHDYGDLFAEWHVKDLQAMIRRDRNHPSVFIWSIGNEVMQQRDVGLTKHLVDLVKAEDPTRLVSNGYNDPDGGRDCGAAAALDIMGVNYFFGQQDRWDKDPRYQNKPTIGSETSSCVSSRGQYFQNTPGQVQSYDNNWPGWGCSPDSQFRTLEHWPHLLGEYVWTGFDYLGEPNPVNSSRSSYFGICDLAGFPKDRFYIYQAHWRPDFPMAHIIPQNWNWPQRVGQDTPVHVYTSGNEAELFLNGKSLGRQVKKAKQDYRLVWNVKYEPGELKVVAYKNGKAWSGDVVQTTGAATQLFAAADRAIIEADGQDLSFITVRVADKAGLTVPDACPLVKFEVDGPGEIVAVDNGDATSFEPFQAKQHTAYNGLALVIVRAKPGQTGAFAVKAVAAGLAAATVTITAKGKAEPRDPAVRASSPVQEIIVVCKTHFDIGFTHRAKDIVQYYRTTMIDHALDVMEKSKSLPSEEQFVWTAPGWVMAKVLEDWPGQTPQRRQRLEEAFKSGKFITHAAPFTLQADFMEPEELARGFVFASSISRKHGLPLPAAVKMTDVPSQTYALATALAHGGIRFMHFGCNSACSYPEYPPLFWWQGPDSSRVLAMYSASYGTCDALYPKDWLCSKDPKKDGCLGHNLLPPAGWPYKTWMALIVTPDNTGPPSADAVKALFDEAARKLPGVKVRMGKMEDFADAILAEHPDLPVVQGEAPDTWIHGIMCDPGGMRIARNICPLMPAVETLNTQLRAWGLALPDTAEEIARAYEQSNLFGEHTWGGSAVLKVYGDAFHKLPPAEYADLEGSWEDKTDYIRGAAKIVTALLDTHLAALASAVNCEGPRVVVYNPLAWQRSGMVCIKTTDATLKDLSTGKVFPLRNGSFLATDVPASGYKTYQVEMRTGEFGSREPARPARANTLENEFFEVTLDPEQGTIRSLIDKRTGRQWVDSSAALGLGQYLNERFDFEQTLRYVRDYQNGRTDFGGTQEWLHPCMHKPGMPPGSQVPYRAASPRHGIVHFDRSEVSDTAIMDLPGDPAKHLAAVTLRVALHRGQPYLDLELTIRDKAKDNWPEADWLCLPLKIASPRFCVGRALGAMDPARDILPGANRHLYAAGTGVTLTDADGNGIGLCSPDCPLVSLDTPGCWKFSRDFVPKRPMVFLNLYNNMWNTNFRYWYPGTWSSRVRLWTFGKDATTGSALVMPALETRLPLLAVVADGPAGKLPAARTGLALSRPGVLVTAFGADPDGVNKGTLLRIWDQSGATGELVVTLPVGLQAASATPVDLRGEKSGEPIRIERGKLTFILHAYAPASFILM